MRSALLPLALWDTGLPLVLSFSATPMGSAEPLNDPLPSPLSSSMNWEASGLQEALHGIGWG